MAKGTISRIAVLVLVAALCARECAKGMYKLYKIFYIKEECLEQIYGRLTFSGWESVIKYINKVASTGNTIIRAFTSLTHVMNAEQKDFFWI